MNNILCDWFIDNNIKCKRNIIENTKYCKFHQHVSNYTDDDILNKMKCDCCKRILGKCDFSDHLICNTCYEKYRNKKNDKNIIKCHYENCNNNRCVINEYPKYCGLHQRIGKLNELQKEGSRICGEYIRECFNILDNDDISRCKSCKNKMGECDIEKKKNNMENNIQEEKKTCTKCTKIFEISEFIQDGKQYVKCKRCVCNDKSSTVRRRKRNKCNYNEKDDIKGKRRHQKMLLRIKNPDRYTEYYEKKKATYIKNLGLYNYRSIMAQQMYNWRKNNIKKYQEYMNKYYNTEIHKYYYYYYKAYKYNISFELTKEDAINLFNGSCHYCGEKKDILNGIDRIDANFGYIINNCVSCCVMCNYMKIYWLNDVQFIAVLEHIFTYHGIFDGKLRFYLFIGTAIKPNIVSYRNRAKKKNILFDLKADDFYAMTYGYCYLCGRKSKLNNYNGIYRINNNIGYTIKNTRSCCCICNYIKNNHKFIDVIKKIKMIIEYKNNIKINFDDDAICDKILNQPIDLTNRFGDYNKSDTHDLIRKEYIHYNKKTKDELNEIKINKQKIKDLYMMNEYKKYFND